MQSIVSMTTINEKCPQALFPITISSLLKLANHANYTTFGVIQCICIIINACGSVNLRYFSTNIVYNALTSHAVSTGGLAGESREKATAHGDHCKEVVHMFLLA